MICGEFERPRFEPRSSPADFCTIKKKCRNENQIFHPSMGMSVTSEYINASPVKTNHSPLLGMKPGSGRKIKDNYIQSGEGRSNGKDSDRGNIFLG